VKKFDLGLEEIKQAANIEYEVSVVRSGQLILKFAVAVIGIIFKLWISD